MGHRTLNIDGNTSHGVVDHGHYLVVYHGWCGKLAAVLYDIHVVFSHIFYGLKVGLCV